MNNRDHYRIIPLEMGITLMAVTIATGIITVPQKLAETVDGPDGWMSLLIGGGIVMTIITLYTCLQRNFQGRTILQFFAEGRLGTWISKGLALLFIIYFVTQVGFQARVLGIVVKMYLIDQTPTEVIIGLILLTSAYAVSKGVQGVVHLSLMFVPFILIVALATVIFNIGEFSLSTFRPVMAEGITPALLGVQDTTLSFSGFETLFFLMAFMKQADLRSSVILNVSMLSIVILSILITVMTYSLFTVEQTKYIIFPMMELAKEIEIPGGFIERLESLLMTVWVMAIFLTLAIFHFLAVSIIRNHFMPKKKGTYLPVILIFFAFTISFIPNNMTETKLMEDWLGALNISLACFVLVIGFLTVWLRKKRQSISDYGDVAK